MENDMFVEVNLDNEINEADVFKHAEKAKSAVDTQ
jgi:hypothetical protein